MTDFLKLNVTLPLLKLLEMVYICEEEGKIAPTKTEQKPETGNH